jgi:hypothetical protein
LGKKRDDAAMKLVRYDAMCSAIDAAHKVDEVKDIRDKAVALEHYARQAQNTDAERRACEIRLRAERKAGQLLAKMPKANGAKGNPGGRGSRIVRSSDTTTLADLGISKDQSSQWQKLGAMPQRNSTSPSEKAGDDSCGFTIITEGGGPIVDFVYPTRGAAESAATHIGLALEGAVSVQPYRRPYWPVQPSLKPDGEANQKRAQKAPRSWQKNYARFFPSAASNRGKSEFSSWSSPPSSREQRGDADAEQHEQARDVAPPLRLQITQQDKNDPPT